MAKKGHIPWNKGIRTNKPASNRTIIDKDELKKLYVDEKWTSEELANLYNCSSTTIRNWLKRYEIPIRQNGEAVKLERSKWSDEKELERARKVSATWANKTEDELAEIQAKKMLSGNINSPSAIAKAHATRKKNGTSKISKSEKLFYEWLIRKGFDQEDIIWGYYGPNYGDNRYPYNCDFYIKSRDLFIEYNGHQTHGPDIWDENNQDHLKLLIKYQDAGYDMTTWFKRDLSKLAAAIQNKINLVLVYPKYKTYLIKNGEITTIDINDIYKI